MQHRISISLKLKVTFADYVSDFMKYVFISEIFELLMRIKNNGGKFCSP